MFTGVSEGVLPIGVDGFGARLRGAILKRPQLLHLSGFVAAKRSYLPIALRPDVVLDGFAGALEKFFAVGAVYGFHDRCQD